MCEKIKTKRIITLLLAICLTVSLIMMPENTATVEAAVPKADVVFVIDSTGSMGDEINNVKTNVSAFSKYLEDLGVDLRIAIVEYKDITVFDEADSTKAHLLNYSPWHYTADQVISALNTIQVIGGGDTPETLVDALGCVLDEDTMLFRSDAHKFAIALTDADYKANNNYGYSSMEEVIDELVSRQIYTSVITSTYYSSTYRALYENTGGIFGDIYSDFSAVLQTFADSILGISTANTKAIYVLPGYMGSKLYDSEGNEIWVDADRLVEDVIAYTLPTGKTSIMTQNSDGTGTQVHVDMAKDKYGVRDTYKAMLDQLNDECGEEYDVVFFPYNWLADLSDSAASLEEHIKESGYESVVFVTHSTGGLLASNYIARSRENKLMVQNAILIAAPLYGTYSSLEPIETGTTSDLPSMLESEGIELGFIKGQALRSWIKGVTVNSPTTYQLLPSIEYLKLMPAIYEDDFTNPVTTAARHYEVLNGSSNINSNLTNGNDRSHKYFRETILKGDVVSVLGGGVVPTLEEVDTLLIGSSSGNSTPAIPVYKSKLLGGTRLSEIMYKSDGDGTVMGVSAFATKTAGTYVLDHLDFPGVTHGSLASDSTVLDAVCAEINGLTRRESLRTADAYSTDASMSDTIKFVIESDSDYSFNIYDKDGLLVDVNSNDDITYRVLAEEEGYYSSQMYIPNTGYRAEFVYGDSSGTEIEAVIEVSTLDSDGYKTSSAFYRCTATGNNGLIYSFDMTEKTVTADNVGALVAGATQPVSSYYTDWTIESDTAIAKVGDTHTVALTGGAVEAGQVTAESLRWTSSDESVVTVSENGTLTAVGYGTATIAVAQRGSMKTATCTVTVTLEATTVRFDDLEMYTGERVKIIPIFNSEDVTETDISYTYNGDIISIDEHGVITALNVGEVTVTGTAPGGAVGSFKVTVGSRTPIAVESVAILPDNVTVGISGTTELTAVVLPEAATNKEVRWYVDDESIATISVVDGVCTVTGVSLGTTSVVAVSIDGGFTARTNVTVAETTATAIKITKPALTMMRQKTTLKLDLAITPVTARPTITWTSSNAAVVTVDENGLLTAKKPGTVMIKAATDNGLSTLITVRVIV